MCPKIYHVLSQNVSLNQIVAGRGAGRRAAAVACRQASLSCRWTIDRCAMITLCAVITMYSAPRNSTAHWQGTVHRHDTLAQYTGTVHWHGKLALYSVHWHSRAAAVRHLPPTVTHLGMQAGNDQRRANCHQSLHRAFLKDPFSDTCTMRKVSKGCCIWGLIQLNIGRLLQPPFSAVVG
jgi:hypothetical protein